MTRVPATGSFYDVTEGTMQSITDLARAFDAHRGRPTRDMTDSPTDGAAEPVVVGTWAGSATPTDVSHPTVGLTAWAQQTPHHVARAAHVSTLASAETEQWKPETRGFVPMRIDVDIDGLRAELIRVAVLWLGLDAAVPVANAIANTRPGVDDFVATISAIGRMKVPPQDETFIRTMAREMHYRATEALCGA
jgi:hypothetical protein